MEKATDELHWRDTYFILFPHARRPELEKVTKALSRANSRFELENLSADESGLVQSLFVESHEDHAAVEISYEVGDGVIEENLEWAKQLQNDLTADQLQEIIRADARLSLAHFERMPAGSGPPAEAAPFAEESGDEFGDEFGSEAENFEMFDPTCLLTVVDALSQLTDGLTFDPASGEILS